MKRKYLIIVSLILAILTIGAVSASDDASADVISEDSAGDDVIAEDAGSDELAVEDNGEDSVIESSDNDNVVASSDSEDILGNSGNYNGNEYRVYIRDDYFDMDTNAGSYDVGRVYDDCYVNGRVAFYVDGKQVYSKSHSVSEANYNVYVNINDLVLPSSITAGMHTVTITYFKAGAPQISQSTSVFFYPALSYLHSMSVGEPNALRVWAGPGVSGTVGIYLYDNFLDRYNPVANINIVNGVAVYPFSSPVKQTLDYKLGYTINGLQYSDYATVYVKDNTPGYSASVSSSINAGKAATVTFKGVKTNGEISIYVDGKIFKKSTYFGGKYTDMISGLSVGTHQVTIQYSRGDDFYSKTFNVKVKSVIKLKLKKVTVKKSAKKLVLKATLKINGKAAKKKKVIFKFNGKKFKAKTNKKGVAKVVIKKKFLKKLKVGKKVKYSVKYGKKTVKRTAKVKK